MLGKPMTKKIILYILRWFLIILASFAVINIIVYFNQRNYIYFPDNQDFDNCPRFAESKKINYNGTRMYYTEIASEILVVYYRGNAGSACDRFFIKDILKNNGYASIFVEYAGFSNDSRSPSKELILKDVENVNNFLENIDYEKIIFMGTSLGSSVAAYHQTLRKPDKITLFSAFDKLSNVGKIHFPFLPVRFLLKEEYNASEWLKNYEGKMLLVHGSEDKITPIKNARKLFESVSSTDKKLLEIEGENHNSILGSDEAWETVLEFLSS